MVRELILRTKIPRVMRHSQKKKREKYKLKSEAILLKFKSFLKVLCNRKEEKELGTH